MDIVEIIEIFALVTGVPYIVLEVLQRNSMWYFGIATGLACAYSFASQHLWLNMALNFYYAGMSVWGLYRWRKDSQALRKDPGEEDATVHLGRMDGVTTRWSAVVFALGTALLVWLLGRMEDSNPTLDAVSTMMSVVATYWLGRSIPYHWIIWVVADIILVVMCFKEGQYWLTMLYAAYVVSAAYGMFHWLRKGKYVN